MNSAAPYSDLNFTLEKLVQFLKKIWLAIVFIGFSSAQAGVYEDFFLALRNDNDRVVRQLLARGFDPNTLDPQKRPALVLAVTEGSIKVAQLLLASPQTDPNLLNSAGESALMMASIKGHDELARQLIARGADVNKPGWTPLHYAATGGHVQIVRLLLEHHAYVDAESPNGTTPLMMAAQYGSTAALKLLLEEGAQPEQTNERGLKALDFALLGSRPDAIALLSALVKKPAPPAPVPAPVASPQVQPAAPPLVPRPAPESKPAVQAAPQAAPPAAPPAAPKPEAPRPTGTW